MQGALTLGNHHPFLGCLPLVVMDYTHLSYLHYAYFYMYMAGFYGYFYTGIEKF